MDSNRTAPKTPLISVLVPTHGRPDRVRALLARLAAQTVPMDSFELILIDDGGDPPVAIDVRELGFACTVLQRKNAGPAAARNAGLAQVAAPLVLILNDDAVPASDLIERHLAAHASATGKTAVLGTFHFTEEALRSPLVQVLDATDRLFAFTSLQHGQRHPWTYFWTCNISLPITALFEVGGFDEENFDRAICEDVEIGFRLQKAGWSVLYDERCVAHHDHVLTPRGYAARAFQLGIYQHRLRTKHTAEALGLTPFPSDTKELKKQLMQGIQAGLAPAEAFFEKLEEIESSLAGRAIPDELLREIEAGLDQHSAPYCMAGIYQDLTGIDPIAALEAGATPGTSVAAIIVSYNALANTRRCVESLRAASDPRFPLSLIVVDNGSNDGSAEWLRDQPDVQLVLNEANHGAPRARNQGLRLVQPGTDWIAFFDNDVVVPEGWMERALYHGAGSPDVGSIALCANRASKLQVVPYEGPSDQPSINAFASDHAAAAFRKGDDATLFTSLAVLVRSDVMQRLGGYDESFSPWGFEDDDLALRIRLAGYRNRVAQDTFVYHAHYDGPAKEARHAQWLHQNWKAFLEKWSPSALGSPLFDYSKVVLPQLGQATEAQLYFALPDVNSPPPTWLGQPGSEPTPSAADRLPAHEIEPARTPARTTPTDGHQRANVLIMGCGRSGTSMVTGMLADAGWNVGDRPYEPRPANPKGFFETAEINGINEYLLSTAVTNEAPLRSMQHWLAYAPEPLDLEVSPGIRHRIEALSKKGPFAYKDPRFCYTLPAWRPSMPDAKYVCIFREPSASAASIVKEVETEDYLAGVGVDFERAVEIWDAMYRQILDVHSEEGEWLFLHFDQLFTPEGVAKLEAFVGAPVAADFPERRFQRSASTRPVAASVGRTFEELCQRAGATDAPAIAVQPEPTSVQEVDAPELSVLICTYQRKETLLRCLASFENQTAVGRYEILVVNDGATDGTKEALDRWEAKVPLRILHRENGGLAAARNTGLREARGEYVLLVNDDTIASPELVAQHLAAHAKYGPNRAVLGTFEQPRAALDNALMRVIEETTLVFCYQGLDPNRLHDWNRFWTCNVSVSLEDVRRVGLFDESFRHYGCEDTDLAYRLEKECGTRVVYAPLARAEHEHILTFQDLRHRSRTVSSAYVRFFAKHPEALTHPSWRHLSQHSVAAKEEMLVRTLPDRARAEAFAEELSRIDLGDLERAGPEGFELADAIVARLKAYLAELNFLWWAEGEVEATAQGVGVAKSATSAKAKPALVAG
ncbi:Chondroitin synthase [Planctomycetes bacterium Poly30]|uniref:Chondroitin synthase n=1 Tax=Saltatorellus ferox TaxID=2528018 RepID=A0A518EN37_9BACT|nr:Chondroitin synthase [Planctomycetes bacterium Poly30]